MRKIIDSCDTKKGIVIHYIEDMLPNGTPVYLLEIVIGSESVTLAYDIARKAIHAGGKIASAVQEAL